MDNLGLPYLGISLQCRVSEAGGFFLLRRDRLLEKKSGHVDVIYRTHVPCFVILCTSKMKMVRGRASCSL